VLPFYPFWRLIGEPVAARVQGAVFLRLTAWLASRLARVPFGVALLAGAVYPVYSLAFIADMGPVGLSLLLLLCALLAGQRALDQEDPRRSLPWAAAAGLSIGLGVFVKPVFLWCAPALVVFAVWRSHQTKLTLRAFARRRAAVVGVLMASMGLPLAALMEARDVHGHAYYEVLLQAGPAPDARTLQKVRRMDRYFLDGSHVLPKTLVLRRSSADMLPMVIAVTALLGGLLVSRERRIEIAIWCAMSLGVFGFMVTTRGVQEPHHVAFPLFFLIVALAVALGRLWLERRPVVGLLAAVTAAYWALLLLRLPSAEINPQANHDKDRLLALVREQGLDSRTVQVHSTWGTYYIAHLFGHPRQIVLAIDDVVKHPNLLERVRSIAAHERRDVLILSTCGAKKLRTPDSERILGPPSERLRFGNWCAVAHSGPATAPQGSPSSISAPRGKGSGKPPKQARFSQIRAAVAAVSPPSAVMRSRRSPPARPLRVPETCCAVAHADRVALLNDSAAYFDSGAFVGRRLFFPRVLATGRP
jgi:hypothetical protein